MKRWGAILAVMSLALAALPMAAAASPLPPVDLSITKTGPTTVTVGNPVTYTITVGNLEGATGVTVTDTAVFNDGGEGGEDVVILSASGEGWECGIDGSAYCSPVSDTPGAISVGVQAPDSPGTIVNTATVSSNSDPNELNNTAIAETIVEDEVADGSDERFLDEPNEEPFTLATTGGQTGWDAKMFVPANSPPGQYRLTELADPVAISKGSVEYEAPPLAKVTVEVSCNSTQCPKRRFLDLVVFVIKTDDDGKQHLLPPCHLTIKVGRRTITINRTAPCVLSVTRAGNDAPLIWAVKVLGGPDPGLRGR